MHDPAELVDEHDPDRGLSSAKRCLFCSEHTESAWRSPVRPRPMAGIEAHEISADHENIGQMPSKDMPVKVPS